MTEAFSFLDPIRRVAGVEADFIGRIEGVAVDVDREEALARLESGHRRRMADFFGRDRAWHAEQVHGAEVAVVAPGDGGSGIKSGADGLLTAVPGRLLGIHVADCGAIWLGDRANGAVGLLHSGRKGTEREILRVAVAEMGRVFGTRPADLVAVLGPCIRPPNYEVDFAAAIGRQAEAAGIGEFHDCGIDTAADPENYYSYRREKGRTGRMLALVMRREEP